MKAIDIARKSIYPSVVEWSNEITDLMEKEISSSSALMQRERSKGKTVGETDIELLLNFKPLLGIYYHYYHHYHHHHHHHHHYHHHHHHHHK